MSGNISAGTIGRTLCLALALINQILSATGHSVIPIDDEQIELLVSTLLTVVTAIAAWWKNNDFSAEAIAGTKYMKALKAERSA